METELMADILKHQTKLGELILELSSLQADASPKRRELEENIERVATMLRHTRESQQGLNILNDNCMNRMAGRAGMLSDTAMLALAGCQRQEADKMKPLKVDFAGRKTNEASSGTLFLRSLHNVGEKRQV